MSVESAPGRAPRNQAKKTPPRPPSAWGMVRADEAKHQALADALAQIERLQSDIAETDLAIETLRCALADFTRRYEDAIADERGALRRVQTLLGHVSRWLHLLRDDGGRRGAPARSAMHAVHAQRDRELRAQHPDARADGEHAGASAAATQVKGDAFQGAQASTAGDGRRARPAPELTSWHARRRAQEQRLKQAFRTLARRYHPDLAEEGPARAQCSRLMAHINTLYEAGDIARLEVLAEQATTGADTSADARNLAVPVAERLAEAQARLAWFAAVHRSLEEELQALEHSPTCELWYALEDGPRAARFRPHLLRALRQDLHHQTEARLKEIPNAMRALEDAVQMRNHASHRNEPRATQRAGALEARAEAGLGRATGFDSQVQQDLMRLSLEALSRMRVSPRVAEWARKLEARAVSEPAFVRLVLLTYVVQLAPGGMPGLERFEQLGDRFAACSRRDRRPTTLAEALLACDNLVEYVPTQRGTGPLQAQLVFRDRTLAQVVPQALRNFAVRALFGDLLRHLGEEMVCQAPRCRRRVYALPLFLLRGLDHIRALVCPQCHHVLRSYVLAKGNDVQAVLNAAYLEFNLVEEVNVQFAQANVGMQMLPQEYASMSVRALRLRLHQHLFARNGIELPGRYLDLYAQGHRLSEASLLSRVPSRQLQLVVDARAGISEAEVLTTLRFRLQTRFAPTSHHH